jgi:NAD+ diphosphatase
MEYAEGVNLPFNFECIRDGFAFVYPGDEPPPGPGFWIVLQGGMMVVREEADSLRLHHGDLPEWGEAAGTPICVGTWQGEPLRAVLLRKGVEPPPGYVAEPFNATLQRLPDDIMTLGGLASQVAAWERKSARCSVCGGETAAISGTWGKRCEGCGIDHFPPIHPCIIVLVRKGDRFLLGRKREWPPGRYSLVAGFVDFGESLEECVRREVREETGVEVTEIRYVGSQSWPFPSQLMAGFVAEWRSGEIDVSGDELEDARWFSREELPSALPPRRSIARWIIDRYALPGSTEGEG